MGVTISEQFDVRARPETVWAYLIDPRQVIECLPGAELLEVQDERTFSGRMRVKVGPVTASFRGKARFDELDASARRVRMSGEGQDTSGAGTAKMMMTSEVTALPNGNARVMVQSDVEVMGKLVQFGRGLMEEVSRQMFRQFAACVQQRLEAPPPVSEVALGATPASAPAAAPSPPSKQVAQQQPLRVLPLLLAALRAWLRKLLGRGRQPPTA